jgi:predicted esterase
MIAVQAVKTAPVFIGTGDPDPYVPVEREYALKTYKTWATPSASMKFNK